MAWDVTAEHERFDEAVDWFKSRIPVADDQVSMLNPTERARAFRIAGVTELRVVHAVHEELLRALEDGLPLEEFQGRVRARLEGFRLEGHELETIFRTNVQTAYNTGRWYELTDPDVTAVRPFLIYDAVLDTRTTQICKGLDGTIKSHDDPFVLQRWPPLHFRCRSGWRSLRRSEAEERGITQGEPGPKPPEGFGLAPPLRGDDLPAPKRETYGDELFDIFEQRERDLDEVSRRNADLEEAERAARQREDPAFWLTEYRSRYGERAGKSVAWGRAMEHRGRRKTLEQAVADYDDLVTRGVQMPDRLGESPLLAAQRLLPEGVEAKRVEDLVEHFEQQGQTPALVAQLKSAAAMIGHHRSISPKPISMPKGSRSGRRAPNEARRDEAHRRATAFYTEMADGSLQHPTDYKVVWAGTRAWHRAAVPGVLERGKLNLTGFANGSDFVHEWGHAIDNLNRERGVRAFDFLDARTRGEVVESLRSITGNSSYRSGERTKRDGFVSPYMGKVYASGDTEIDSMAFEWIATGRAADLYERDPELFWFALGQLAGGLSG